MNIQDLRTQDERESGVIVDPNLQRFREKQQAEVMMESTEKKAVTPEQLGFQPTVVAKEEDDDDVALKQLDDVIENKIKEMENVNELLDQTEGDLTESDIRESLGQNYADELDGGRKNLNINSSNKSMELELEEYNRSVSLEEEYVDELEDEDLDGAPEPFDDIKPELKPVVPQVHQYKDSTVELPSSLSDISFPDEDEELDLEDEDDSEEDDKEQMEKFKKAIKEKIKPVNNIFDLSSFTISKKPVALNSTLKNVNGPQNTVADWALMRSERPVSMRGFTGVELDKLNSPTGATRLHTIRDQYGMIYNHIIDHNKPETLEQWAKCTSFLDIEHLWAAIYRSCFEGANYLPYNCPDQKKCKEVFLTDNIPFMDMVKFKNNDSKVKFNKVMAKESDPSHGLYTSTLQQISNEYAIAFKEPSIYDMLFETAMLDQKFISKYSDAVSLIVYIDSIYYIDSANSELRPVTYKVFPNDLAKTTKAKVIQYSKVIQTLSSDQYSLLLTNINSINELGDDITYMLPSVTCPKCGSRIEEEEHKASELVFTRHQLATMAAM